MVELVSTLNGDTQKEVKEGYMYMIDFSKLQSVNDLILILASMGIVFPYDHPNINQLSKFLNVDNPIPLPTQPNIEDRIFKQHKEQKLFNK